MANILQTYQDYKIMPQLQLHQLRVAAVAQQICNNFQGEVDQDSIIKACLLHDMGNIIKFDLKLFPKFLEPKGLDYWQGVKEEYLKKYGSDEHHASIQIGQELGASALIIECIEAIGFSKAVANAASSNMNIKICDYADNRVDPQGVVSLEGRFADLRQRYGHWIKKRGNDAPTLAFEAALRQIEKQIFAQIKIKPTGISERSAEPIIEKLKNYEI